MLSFMCNSFRQNADNQKLNKLIFHHADLRGESGGKMYFEDIDLNSTVRIPAAHIKRETILDFANNFDPLRIHKDPQYAKTTRFGDIIAPGVMSFMSVWAKFVETGFFGDELVAGTMTSMEWLCPVYADDVLYGDVTVKEKERRNAHNGEITFFIRITNQSGITVLENTTKTIVKCREKE